MPDSPELIEFKKTLEEIVDIENKRSILFDKAIDLFFKRNIYIDEIHLDNEIENNVYYTTLSCFICFDGVLDIQVPIGCDAEELLDYDEEKMNLISEALGMFFIIDPVYIEIHRGVFKNPYYIKKALFEKI